MGSSRSDLALSVEETRHVLADGARWAVARGYGLAADIERIEEGGRIETADPDAVGRRAIDRGRSQLGTVGSGNHFVEVGYVAEIYDEAAAAALGLGRDAVTVIVHTGSRGLGYQVCDDHLSLMMRAADRHGIHLPDRQLCCAPLGSPEARQYLGAMAAAANFAFANRQVITHWVRESLSRLLGEPAAALDLALVYDVCHNIAKFEMHRVGGIPRRLCVHRKGATRALPGQPVLIPGDMGRCSYVLRGEAGPDGGPNEAWGSSCHGAGRVMSRAAASRAARGRAIAGELADRGIYVRSASRATLVEEIPEAYKDVSVVVDVVHGAGLSRKVAQLRPLAVVKG